MSCAGRGIVLRQIDRLFRDGTLGGLGDGQLLKRYLSGNASRRDETAFEALVDMHGPMVLRVCQRMLRDPRDVEDAFQATFLVLVRKAPTIQDRGLLSSWLYGVAYRVARRARNQTLRRRGRETTVGDLVVAARSETSDRFEVDQVLDQELNRLPEKYRAPLILCYLRGQTHDQAADELRCPVGTVNSRLARGKDLLKERLIRRGFAPSAMAAILGTGPNLPAQLLIEAVPPSLVSATVKAAFGFGSAQTIQAGTIAASALVLAQGVLTTMRIAQLKWIGLSILATSLSAGGAVAVSYASTRQPGPAETTNSASSGFDPQDQSKAGQDDEVAKLSAKLKKTQDDHAREKDTLTTIIRELRDKVENLMQNRPSSAPTTRDVEVPQNRPASAPTTSTIRNMEVQLKLALEEFDRSEGLLRNGAITLNAREQSRGKVLGIAAQLEGLNDEIDEEIARLKLEMSRKNAEREKAEAQKEIAESITARNERLNKRKPGMVSAEDVAKAEGERKLAGAQVAIVDAEIAEVGLRIQQLERRRERIEQAVALAKGAKTAAPAPSIPDVNKPENPATQFKVPNNNLERRGFTAR